MKRRVPAIRLSGAVKASDLIGMTVRNPQEETLGKVNDLAIRKWENPTDPEPIMNHNHRDDDLRSAVKHVRLEARYRTAGASDFEGTRPEAETLQPTGSSRGSGMLSDEQRSELTQASERNKHFLNPMQSVWPTPSA